SETFLRVYLARTRYRAGTAFIPRLFTIARNLALGELRHRSVVIRAQQRLTEDASMNRTEWLAEQLDLGERVREALAGLPEEERSARSEERRVGKECRCGWSPCQ